MKNSTFRCLTVIVKLSRPVFTNIEQSVDCVVQRRRRCWLSKVYFQCEKCSLSKEKFRNFFFEINFEIYVNLFLSQENFQCEQPTFERNKCQNFISQFWTCSILRNFTEEMSLMERSDWSVGQCLLTSDEASTASSISLWCRRCWLSNVKVLTFERKISKFVFQNRISKLISSVKGAWWKNHFAMTFETFERTTEQLKQCLNAISSGIDAAEGVWSLFSLLTNKWQTHVGLLICYRGDRQQLLISAWQAERARHADIFARILAAFVEFKLNGPSWRSRQRVLARVSRRQVSRVTASFFTAVAPSIEYVTRGSSVCNVGEVKLCMMNGRLTWRLQVLGRFTTWRAVSSACVQDYRPIRCTWLQRCQDIDHDSCIHALAQSDNNERKIYFFIVTAAAAEPCPSN